METRCKSGRIPASVMVNFEMKGIPIDLFGDQLSRMKEKQDYHMRHNLEPRRTQVPLVSRDDTTTRCVAESIKVDLIENNNEEHDEEENVCVICMERKPSHTLRPCGHEILCASCVWDPHFIRQREVRCPVCRTKCAGIRRKK